MNNRVLIVDDSVELLDSMRRQLRKNFSIDVAESGDRALQMIREQGPYSVVVSDMQMPGMNGVEFLAQVKQLAPDVIRVMLTGNVDQGTAVAAVNSGHIFRFLNKPCETGEMIRVLQSAMEQHRLITAEKELLSSTLTGSVKVLVDLMSLVLPEAFCRCARERRMARMLSAQLELPGIWEIELAAMLCKIGYLTLDHNTWRRMQDHQPLTDRERESVARLPETSRTLLANIPRLEGVAQIVKYQNKCFDGSGVPGDDVSGEALPAGARLLKIIHDFDGIVAHGGNEMDALQTIRQRTGWYDPQMVEVLGRCLSSGKHRPLRQVPLSDLKEGDILAEHLEDYLGYVLVSKGHEITPAILDRLHNSSHRQIREPIWIVDWNV